MHYDVVVKGNYAENTPDIVLGAEFIDQTKAKSYAYGANALLQLLTETAKWMDIWIVTIHNQLEVKRERI